MRSKVRQQKLSEVIFSFRKTAAAQLLPRVSTSDNKASRGRSLLLAGSEQYPGAGILAARAALRMGCGYVMLAQPGLNVSSLENPDFLVCDLNKNNWEKLRFDAFLIGPGFGVTEFTAHVIRRLKEMKIKRVVIDADALTVCAKWGLFPLLPSWIATPHSGELARVLKIPSLQIDQDRMAAVRLAQNYMGCNVLLKGHHTLVGSSQKIYRVCTGNAALAKAGTGDVLAGMITALLAQGLGPVQSALLGAYLHGACANLWVARGKDALSMMATDVIETLPTVIRKVRALKS